MVRMSDGSGGRCDWNAAVALTSKPKLVQRNANAPK